MEESDPMNRWPQRTLSLWEMMMMTTIHIFCQTSVSNNIHANILRQWSVGLSFSDKNRE